MKSFKWRGPLYLIAFGCILFPDVTLPWGNVWDFSILGFGIAGGIVGWNIRDGRNDETAT